MPSEIELFGRLAADLAKEQTAKGDTIPGGELETAEKAGAAAEPDERQAAATESVPDEVEPVTTDNATETAAETE